MRRRRRGAFSNYVSRFLVEMKKPLVRFLTFTLKEVALLGYFAGLLGILIGKAFGVPSLSKSPCEQMANAIESLKKIRGPSTQK